MVLSLQKENNGEDQLIREGDWQCQGRGLTKERGRNREGDAGDRRGCHISCSNILSQQS